MWKGLPSDTFRLPGCRGRLPPTWGPGPPASPPALREVSPRFAGTSARTSRCHSLPATWGPPLYFRLATFLKYRARSLVSGSLFPRGFTVLRQGSRSFRLWSPPSLPKLQADLHRTRRTNPAWTPRSQCFLCPEWLSFHWNPVRCPRPRPNADPPLLPKLYPRLKLISPSSALMYLVWTSAVAVSTFFLVL